VLNLNLSVIYIYYYYINKTNNNRDFSVVIRKLIHSFISNIYIAPLQESF